MLKAVVSCQVFVYLPLVMKITVLSTGRAVTDWAELLELWSPATSTFCVPEVTFLTNVSLASEIGGVVKGILSPFVD
jgi:hypothetical protein